MRRGDIAGDDASLLPLLAAVAEQLAAGLSVSSASPLRFLLQNPTRSRLERLLVLGSAATATASASRPAGARGSASAALTAAENLAMTSPFRRLPLALRSSAARCRG